MPSPYPRMSLVLTPEQHRLLTRLAELQGRSAASYVRGLLDLAWPNLVRLCRHLEDLQEMETEQDRHLQEAIARELEEADDELAEQLSLLDPLDLDDALDAERPPAAEARTDAPRPGRPRLVASTDQPPPCNTGVSSC